MTVTEIKQTLLDAHDKYGFFPQEVVKSIMRGETNGAIRGVDVVCCMLELVYTNKNERE